MCFPFEKYQTTKRRATHMGRSQENCICDPLASRDHRLEIQAAVASFATLLGYPEAKHFRYLTLRLTAGRSPEPLYINGIPSLPNGDWRVSMWKIQRQNPSWSFLLPRQDKRTGYEHVQTQRVWERYRACFLLLLGSAKNFVPGGQHAPRPHNLPGLG